MNQWERASIWFNLYLEFSRNWWAQSRSSIICFIHWAYQSGRHWATNINQAMFPAVCVSAIHSVCLMQTQCWGKAPDWQPWLLLFALRTVARKGFLAANGFYRNQIAFLSQHSGRLLLHRHLNGKYCWANLPLGFQNLAFPTQMTTWPPGIAWEYVYWITLLSFIGWTGILIPPLSKKWKHCKVLMSLTSSCINAMKKIMALKYQPLPLLTDQLIIRTSSKPLIRFRLLSITLRYQLWYHW